LNGVGERIRGEEKMYIEKIGRTVHRKGDGEGDNEVRFDDCGTKGGGLARTRLEDCTGLGKATGMKADNKKEREKQH